MRHIGLSTLLGALVLGAITLAPMTASARSGHAKRTCSGSTHTGTTHHLRTQAGDVAIVFGSEGGNIRPATVTVYGDGTISASGFVTVTKSHLPDPANTLNGIVRLADAAGFFSMPATVACAGVLPDIASRYISFSTTSGTKRVQVHGGCNTPFNQVYAILQATIGTSR